MKKDIAYGMTGFDEDGNTIVDINLPVEIAAKILLECVEQGLIKISLTDSDTQEEQAVAAPRQKRKYKKRKSNLVMEVKDTSIDEHYSKRGIGEEKTDLIKTSLKEGVPVKTIADHVGVAKQTIYIIKNKMIEDGELPNE